MVLAGHSNALYLSKSNAQSRAGGHFFMSSNVELPSKNGAVSTILQIIKAVMSLATEAKVGVLFINCHEAVPARHVLKFLGHPQPPTPMQTETMSEVVLCPILYCIDVLSTYLGKILDFVVVHWSFIFVSHVSWLIVEFI
jgi:hypothetical protein